MKAKRRNFSTVRTRVSLGCVFVCVSVYVCVCVYVYFCCNGEISRALDLWQISVGEGADTATHCNTLQHTDCIHCNTRQQEKTLHEREGELIRSIFPVYQVDIFKSQLSIDFESFLSRLNKLSLVYHIQCLHYIYLVYHIQIYNVCSKFSVPHTESTIHLCSVPYTHI